MDTNTTTMVRRIMGKTLYDADHQRIGEINQLYIDEGSEQPTWASVRTGMFGNKESFVPLAITHVEDQDVVADTSKDAIKEAPKIEPDREMSVDDQRMLYQYYRQVVGEPSGQGKRQDSEDAAGDTKDRDDSHADSRTAGSTDTPQPQSQPPSAHQDDSASTRRDDRESSRHGHGHRSGDDAMARFEGEIRVDKTLLQDGRVRLRKYIVIEDREAHGTSRKEKTDSAGKQEHESGGSRRDGQE